MDLFIFYFRYDIWCYWFLVCVANMIFLELAWVWWHTWGLLIAYNDMIFFCDRYGIWSQLYLILYFIYIFISCHALFIVFHFYFLLLFTRFFKIWTLSSAIITHTSITHNFSTTIFIIHYLLHATLLHTFSSAILSHQTFLIFHPAYNTHLSHTPRFK